MTTTDDPYAGTPSETLRTALLDLSPRHIRALDALASGATQADAGDTAGVTRETVTRWLNHHPAFRAAHEAMSAALAAECAGQARLIWQKAAAVVLANLDDADVRTALAALRAVGARPVLTHSLGPLDATALLDMERGRFADLAPPERPSADDMADLLDSIGAGPQRIWDREERRTFTRLAAAAGIEPDDLNPPTAPERRHRRAQ